MKITDFMLTFKKHVSIKLQLMQNIKFLFSKHNRTVLSLGYPLFIIHLEVYIKRENMMHTIVENSKGC